MADNDNLCHNMTIGCAWKILIESMACVWQRTWGSVGM